jgi:hypothetical protein
MTQKGLETNPRARQNMETWRLVKGAFLVHKTLSWDQLSKLCEKHDHPAGGDAFIRYMLGNGWIDSI